MTTTHEDNPITQDEISAEQVKSYLRSHPNFFEHHAALL
ncbi:MAG TPA: DUF484 family protein, partial [Methylotenera sp.]|nr:DUF484 family protein [Methylotenera sp.]